MSYDAWRGLDTTISQTMRMMGANDVTLGNISNPDNTSAFIATRDAAMVPLQSQQERFYSFIEDIGLIWLDFIQNFYKSGRKIPVEKDGRRTFVPIIDEEINKYTMRLKVDVGPSSMWSEIQAIQTLDNLLARGQISFKQYLERVPSGHIPKKEELLADTQQQESGSVPGGGMPADLGGSMPQLAGLGGSMPRPSDLGAPQMPGMPQEEPEEEKEDLIPGLEEMLSGEKPLEQVVSLPDELKELSEGKPEPETSKLREKIEELTAAGEIDKEVADALLEMIAAQSGAEEILSAAKTAQEQGKISTKAVMEIEKEV